MGMTESNGRVGKAWIERDWERLVFEKRMEKRMREVGIDRERLGETGRGWD